MSDDAKWESGAWERQYDELMDRIDIAESIAAEMKGEVEELQKKYLSASCGWKISAEWAKTFEEHATHMEDVAASRWKLLKRAKDMLQRVKNFMTGIDKFDPELLDELMKELGDDD